VSGRILVVDDNAVNQQLLVSILSRAGHAALGVSSGKGALAAVGSYAPDLVLLDVMMPEMSGHDVCEALKADPATRELPVIFLSALGEPRDKVRGLDMGAADYITKPYKAAEVLARVRLQLRLRLLHSELERRNADLREKQEQLERDLRAAAEIQRAFIPRPGTTIAGLQMSWLFVPCETLGGDSFNVLRLGSNRVGLYMLDVSGHGVPAAMLSIAVCERLSVSGGIVAGPEGELRAPNDVLDALQREFPFDRFERYVTLTYLALDVESGALRYSSAGHPPPLLLRADGELATLDAGGPVIGAGLGDFEMEDVRLGRGDRLFLYTDGLLDLEGPGGRLGSSALGTLVASGRSAPLADTCGALRQTLEEHSRFAPIGDDVSVLAIEFDGA
jgi:sigma-B regulation protein RsbU (phosphoserine phosphatase)